MPFCRLAEMMMMMIRSLLKESSDHWMSQMLSDFAQQMLTCKCRPLLSLKNS